ncbi:PhnD/SsuA/transferrin family substrate-binding protein [Paenibacillus sp. HJL G12]|uniref:PhnD/SsuA/transferrin family substrate-binding protein n=1 Tax=Paenibacillus dendrobii TaxID=2691084 RepID=A0A7X3IGI5_9BACL|nr:ABC transporter substrate-binding protein [Paenibacillus dendrobii]MWV42856.1 PhnD/SsuA/transferrin family substrate-binding protein [Paenibacillus dendrobii]
MKIHLIRRYGLVVMSALLAITLLSACGTAAGEKKGNALKLKIADISTNTVFRVAKKKGIFEKHGIDAELVTFATPAEGVNSLFIKQVDVAFGADFPLLNAVSKGDYSIFASSGTATDLSAGEWKMFARNDIASAADLKGKKLSFSRGTFIPYLWDVYLAQNGVALTDVTLVGQGGFDETYVALKKGEIDAAWVYGSVLNQKFAALTEAHEMTDMSKTPVRLGTGLIASNKLIQDNPDGLIGFMKALDEASSYAQAHPEETADIMYDEVKQPKEATLKDLPKNPWNIGFTEKAYEGLVGQKKYMVEHGIIEKDFNLNDKLNLELVRKAFPDRVIDLK